VPETIAIVNQKGRTGKITSAINLSWVLGYRSKRMLLVDFDPQANATTGLGVDPYSLKVNVYHVVCKRVPIEDAMVKLEGKRIDLVPSSLAACLNTRPTRRLPRLTRGWRRRCSGYEQEGVGRGG